MLPGESAGCEALRAEQAADGIRSVLLPARSVGNNGLLKGGELFRRPLQQQG